MTVYVVHGFGGVAVFASLKLARRYRDKHAKLCTITKTTLRGTAFEPLSAAVTDINNGE